MDYRSITAEWMDALWPLQLAYKSEIGEDAPTDSDRAKLAEAISNGSIRFYGAWDEARLAGCCSVTIGFSTFNYAPTGVFEDFYIRPEYRHRGIARALAEFAFRNSGAASMTVGCADCDAPMYRAIGFSIPLGNLLAFAGDGE